MPAVSRRQFLNWTAASLTFVAADHSCLTSNAHAATRAGTFDARNAMRFADLPDLTAYGLKNVTVVYASELWPKDANRSEPALTFVKSTTIPRVRHRATDLVVIDVEHWKLTGLPAIEIERNIARYVALMETFRSHLPGVQVGLYSMIPIRNYWAPVRGDPAKLDAWRHDNRRLRPIADVVDVIFPSLYTFYDDRKGWTAYAAANIEEARQYGRPVYPFLWPQYHKSWKPIGPDFWRFQLDTVFRQADGMVIWTPARGRPRWNPNAPWWLETVAFLEETGLAGG